MQKYCVRNLYKQRDEITDQAKKMHKGLKFAGELQFGYKECSLFRFL